MEGAWNMSILPVLTRQPKTPRDRQSCKYPSLVPSGALYMTTSILNCAHKPIRNRCHLQSSVSHMSLSWNLKIAYVPAFYIATSKCSSRAVPRWVCYSNLGERWPSHEVFLGRASQSRNWHNCAKAFVAKLPTCSPSRSHEFRKTPKLCTSCCRTTLPLSEVMMKHLCITGSLKITATQSYQGWAGSCSSPSRPHNSKPLIP